MDKIIEKLNQALTESERDKLIGHLAHYYEVMRRNATIETVKEIYGNAEKSRFGNDLHMAPPVKKKYLEGKAVRFWNCGDSFAPLLDFRNRKRLGGVLYNYLLKEMRIGGAS